MSASWISWLLLSLVLGSSNAASAADLRVRVLDSSGAPASDVPLVIRTTHAADGSDLAAARTQSDGIATFVDAERWFVPRASPRIPVVSFDLLFTDPDWLPLIGSVPSSPLELKLPPVGRVTIHVESIAGEPTPAGRTPVLALLDHDGWSVREHRMAVFDPRQRTITFDHVGLGLELEFGLMRRPPDRMDRIASTIFSGPKDPDSSVELAVWPSLGELGYRARISGRLLDASGDPVTSCTMRIDLPYYALERGESETDGIEGSGRTYPGIVGPDGRFQFTLPRTEHDDRWGTDQVFVWYVDQLATLWCFDDSHRRVFEAKVMLRNCSERTSHDIGDVSAVEHHLILRGNIQTSDGQGIEYPMLRLVDRRGRTVPARLWHSSTGWFAFMDWPVRPPGPLVSPSPWTLVVSMRHRPTQRFAIDPSRADPVTLVLEER